MNWRRPWKIANKGRYDKYLLFSFEKIMGWVQNYTQQPASEITLIFIKEQGRNGISVPNRTEWLSLWCCVFQYHTARAPSQGQKCLCKNMQGEQHKNLSRIAGAEDSGTHGGMAFAATKIMPNWSFFHIDRLVPILLSLGMRWAAIINWLNSQNGEESGPKPPVAALVWTWQRGWSSCARKRNWL